MNISSFSPYRDNFFQLASPQKDEYNNDSKVSDVALSLLSSQEKFEKKSTPILPIVPIPSSPDIDVEKVWVEWQYGQNPSLSTLIVAKSKNGTLIPENKVTDFIQTILKPWFEASCRIDKDETLQQRQLDTEYFQTLNAWGLSELVFTRCVSKTRL